MDGVGLVLEVHFELKEALQTVDGVGSHTVLRAKVDDVLRVSSEDERASSIPRDSLSSVVKPGPPCHCEAVSRFGWGPVERWTHRDVATVFPILVRRLEHRLHW